MDKKEMTTKKNVKWPTFLLDVLICSLGAYGGPEAHYGVFTDQMVIKKQYLTEDELLELIALTGILPGPSSTQTIAAIGYKVGGPGLALLTLIVWALPVLIIMTGLSFMSQILSALNISTNGLRYIGPMAVGFIAVASYRLSKKVISDKKTLFLFLLGAIVTYFIHEPWIYPAVLITGGVISIMTTKQKNIWNMVKITPPWHFLTLLIIFALGSVLLTMIFPNIVFDLFASFYRFGYLVIGGGQVVVPMMFSELVEIKQYMTSQEFLTGFGLVQGLPGPMFSFSAYAGGIAAQSSGYLIQIIAALASGLAIFLPGILLIFFVYPVWNQLKEIRAIKISLSGITAVAAGLIAASAITLMQKSGITIDNALIVLVTSSLLLSRKILAPLIVLAVIVIGFVL